MPEPLPEPDSNESRLNPYRFQPNLYDPDHPEWFMYDPELLNAWYWDQFEIELNTDSIFKNKGTPS